MFTHIILVIPGVPMDIIASETSRLSDICIILVTWAPLTSDIAKYIVYVPSRDINMTVSSDPPPVTILRVSNCGDDTRILVAGVNRDGCMGMNSSEVLPILVDTPTASTHNVSATTEGGSTSTSSKQ